MFLKAGALSLGLLVASRLLGLLRESAQAAAFGVTGLADAAVLLVTLPDWIAGVLASGALGYVLLPAWARPGVDVAALQRRVAVVLVAGGSVIAACLILARMPALDVLAPGLGDAMRPAGVTALVFSAIAVPLALLAALWATRLQHEREFVGMYSANLVVNGVVIVSLLAVASSQDLFALGLGVLVAMVARLAWLGWKLPESRPGIGPVNMPPATAWLWAALAAGLPLALPFVARSLASRSGEGALATFNYGWKLVELPLLLAIQLVATLAFPAIARAVAANEGTTAIRHGFALAWTLACACAAGLLLGAPAVAQLLFGWGRMQPDALANVAGLGRVGAWGLLPQACIAVGLTVLAARGRMAPAVLAYAAALGVLLAAGFARGFEHAEPLMVLLNLVLCGVAVVVVIALGPWRDVPWRTFAVAGATLLACDVGSRFLAVSSMAGQLSVAVTGALLVIGVTMAASPELRAALRR